MRKFFRRAIRMLDRLDKAQIEALVDGLAEENETLESSLHSMNAGVIVIDKSGIVTFINRSARHIIPISKAEAVDRHYRSVILDPEISRLIERSEAEQETVHDREFAFDAPGGARIVTCSILPLLLHAEISGSLVYLKDITKKKQAEARLRRAESLAALTTLTAGVAHEIKNPLGSIGIHIQLMQKALSREPAPDSEFFKRNLGIISEEVERLNGIVVDFLFAVRPMDINPTDTSIVPIIEDIMELVGPEFRESGIEMELNAPEDLPLLQLDEKLIKQALLNIVKNSKNAISRTGHISFVLNTEDDNVTLIVRDDGEGIPEENLDKIFEPYFTTKEFGSGLGLTLVYKIIKEHNGEIQLKSRVGFGTDFIMKFPVPQKEKHLISWRGDEQ